MKDVETIRSFVAWCTVFNWVLLLVWWGFIVFAGDWMRKFHGKWFDLSKQTFDTIHYAGMAFLKILIIVFNLVPYLVLRFFF
jgi:hypothetical protein